MENVITDINESAETKAGYEYEPGEQIADKVDWRSDAEQYLNDNLINFISLKDMPVPYYGFSSLTDKWAEYDRLYECRAKEDRGDNKAEYQGNSNIVLSDFHARIEILKTREMNILFNGTPFFNCRPTKESTKEDALFAKRLVNYSIDCIDNFKREVEKCTQERLKYGTWFAYDPFTVKEKKALKVIDYELDDEGNPLIDLFTGMLIKTEPYEANMIKEEKFTDFQHWPTKKVYIHPKIEDIQDQECIFLQMDKSYNQILEMERKGQIAPGEAEYIKENYDTLSGDADLDKAEDEQQPNDNMLMRDETKAFKLWLVYFKYTAPGGERCIYEAIFMQNAIRICGLRKYISEDRYPIKKGCYISIPGYAYGLGVGDLLYSLCMAKTSRFNQIFDIQSFEIKGGGLKDASLLPDLTSMAPGEYKDVPGLSAMLNSGGKPVLAWSELRGAARAGTAWDVLPLIDKNIETGTGATDLLAGMPTNSQVDRTAAGIEQTMEAGNERINSYLANYAEELFVAYARDAYDNYDEFLIKPDDLENMFDPEELIYTDTTGQENSLAKLDSFREISFHFLPVERTIDSEKKLGKINRLVQMLMMFAQSSPRYAKLIEDSLDPAYLLTSVAEALDITDIDRLFPKFNLSKMVMDLQAQLEQSNMQGQMLMQGIEIAKQKLSQLGDQTALGVIGEIEQQMMGVMQNGTV